MNKAIELIKHFETLHDGDLKAIGLQPKLCPAGIWTIGYGHAMTDPFTHKPLKGAADKKRAYELAGSITVSQAEKMLAEDYSRFEASVKFMLNRASADYELGAMSSLAYNIGLGNFKGSSVLRFFNKGDKATAAESFKLWVKCEGKVLKGLQLRRNAEVQLFLNNEWIVE